MASRLLTINFQISRSDRKAIERQIEELIALLDQVDGDPDLEDDELDGDPLDLGEEFTTRLPRLAYGIDQSGPVAYLDPSSGRRVRLP